MSECAWCGNTTGHEPLCLASATVESPHAAPSPASDEAFLAFHHENPHVYRRLVSLAREAKAAGKQSVGIKMLWEVLRWQVFLETTDPDFKLNNNHHSRYARLIMEREPDLRGVFETRELRSRVAA